MFMEELPPEMLGITPTETQSGERSQKVTSTSKPTVEKNNTFSSTSSRR
jgi:hypothetical protein